MTEEKTYNLDDLKAMPSGQAVALLIKSIEISGTIVVRDKNGNIKYDDPTLAGTYGENKL